MLSRVAIKVLACASLLYIIYLVVVCPCDTVLCCHLGQFWIAIAIFFALVFYENGWKTFSMEC